MSVVANVAINLDSSAAARALQEIGRRAAASAEAIGNGFNKAGDRLQAFGQRFQNLGGVLASIGSGAALNGIVRAGLETDTLRRRIEALAGPNKEAGELFRIAGEAARKFGISQNAAADGIADLYGRLRPAGVALKDIQTVFFGVSNAANAMGLSADATSGVMLQLSQALGSGKLQGDELRSIMEQLPAVGQAVAKVMGVTVGQVKQLGADGKITTDIMIRAAAELQRMAAVDPTPMKKFQASIADLQMELGKQLVPLLLPLVEKMTKLLEVFGKLPQPVKQLIAGMAALAGIFVIIAPAIATTGSALSALAGLQIGATIAGWLGAVAPAIVGIQGALLAFGGWLTGTLLPILVGFFSGPVGWTVLAVAAVVAMAIAFREPLMKFFAWLWEWSEPVRRFFVDLWNASAQGLASAWSGAGKLFNTYVVQPIRDAWTRLVDFIPSILKAMANGVGNVFKSIFNGVKNAIRGIFVFAANNLNKIRNLLNPMIMAFNRLPGPDIPLIGQIKVPAFAEGGYVSRPTLAMIGEGGEGEYIVPESKARAFAADILAGASGTSAVTKSSAPSSGGGQPIALTIQTGPVVEFDGERYVTVADLERATRQTAEAIMGRLRTPSSRIALGIR